VRCSNKTVNITQYVKQRRTFEAEVGSVLLRVRYPPYEHVIQKNCSISDFNKILWSSDLKLLNAMKYAHTPRVLQFL
jgi:hypothetical protein